MITIKHDENLAALAVRAGIAEDVIAQAIIDTIDPFTLDDFLAGMTLEKFINEIGYTIQDFVNGLHTHASIPISVLDSSLNETLLKLKFWFMDADEPCRNCGHEVVYANDDMAVQGFLEGKCERCQTVAIKEV